MIGLDTNVLVRYFAQDDKEQALIASEYIENHCTIEEPCFVGHIVLSEFAWVLERAYGLSREEIHHAIENLLDVSEIEVLNPQVVWKALRDYRESNIGFPDHLIARGHQANNCKTTMTFDKKAAYQSGFELLG